MKVSALSEYREKSEKTGIKVWDHVYMISGGGNYTIVPTKQNYYAAVRRDSGNRWRDSVEIESAMNRNFTKSELELILRDLDDWEVVEE